MVDNYIILLLSCLDKALNLAINWHIAAFVFYKQYYYIFNNHFDFSLYTSPNFNKPQICNEDRLF